MSLPRQLSPQPTCLQVSLRLSPALRLILYCSLVPVLRHPLLALMVQLLLPTLPVLLLALLPLLLLPTQQLLRRTFLFPLWPPLSALPPCLLGLATPAPPLTLPALALVERFHAHLPVSSFASTTRPSVSATSTTALCLVPLPLAPLAPTTSSPSAMWSEGEVRVSTAISPIISTTRTASKRSRQLSRLWDLVSFLQ
jgi:hypothetical protein